VKVCVALGPSVEKGVPSSKSHKYPVGDPVEAEALKVAVCPTRGLSGETVKLAE
jgi:hypothetical protein